MYQWYVSQSRRMLGKQNCNIYDRWGVCTRSCKFCNVKTGRPAPLDPAEPENIANSVKLLGLKHAVITSVDRDDLADLGAAHWVKVIEAVKRENPETTMEVLIPDFQGRQELVQQVINVVRK